MASPEFRQMLRFVFIVGFVGLFLLLSVHFISTASAEALAQPAFQDTSYPGMTLNPPAGPTSGYPGANVTPQVGPTNGYPGGNPTISPSATLKTVTTVPAGTSAAATRTATKTGTQVGTVAPGISPTPSGVVTGTATVENFFLTENAEMGASSVTPPASLTPVATGTITSTQRPTRTRTPLSTLVSASSEDGQGLDWGLFWIGFAVPVVMACGVVLYLLDRRPELFSFKRK